MAVTMTDSAGAVRARALTEIRQMIFDRLGDRSARVFLFGSCARGTWRQSSDIDVAIEPLEPVSDDLFADIRDALDESDIPYFVDVVDLRRVDPAFRTRVLREGIAWTPP